MACTQEQYEQARAVMGTWIEETMDFLAKAYDFDKAIEFARTILGPCDDDDPYKLINRAQRYLRNIMEDLEPAP